MQVELGVVIVVHRLLGGQEALNLEACRRLQQPSLGPSWDCAFGNQEASSFIIVGPSPSYLRTYSYAQEAFH